jgi:hypothetical protein
MTIGRPPIIGDHADAIVRNVAAGMPYEVAASLAGVSEATFHDWMNRGRAALTRRADPTAAGLPCPTCGQADGNPCLTRNGKIAAHLHIGRVLPADALSRDDTPYAVFAEQVETAKAQAHARNLGLIQKAAGNGAWQAAAWFLERRYPDLYARRVLDVNVAGKDGGPIKVDVSVDHLADSLERFLDGDADSPSAGRSA